MLALSMQSIAAQKGTQYRYLGFYLNSGNILLSDQEINNLIITNLEAGFENYVSPNSDARLLVRFQEVNLTENYNIRRRGLEQHWVLFFRTSKKGFSIIPFLQEGQAKYDFGTTPDHRKGFRPVHLYLNSYYLGGGIQMAYILKLGQYFKVILGGGMAVNYLMISEESENPMTLTRMTDHYLNLGKHWELEPKITIAISFSTGFSY
jgi:hypothetical protein